MPAVYRYLFPAMWLGWAAYWWIASGAVKPVQQRESLASRLSYIAPIMLAVFLIATPSLSIPFLRERFVPRDASVFAVGATLTAAGLLFAVWARRHLGRNWSAVVTIRQDHELITSGPYAIVRHPIYSGVLLALVGSALAVGQWRAVLALAIALTSFVRKLRLEERWMREHFGDGYEQYCRRVRALIPFVA